MDQTKYQLGHCCPKKFVGAVCSQDQGSGGGQILVQMTNRIMTHRYCFWVGGPMQFLGSKFPEQGLNQFPF